MAIMFTMWKHDMQALPTCKDGHQSDWSSQDRAARDSVLYSNPDVPFVGYFIV